MNYSTLIEEVEKYTLNTLSDYSDAYQYMMDIYRDSNNNSLEHNTMFEKEAKAMEKAMESVGQIPSLQSKVDAVTDKVNKMKFISPVDYVECESCGLLVNKNKAQVFSSVETQNSILRTYGFTTFNVFASEPPIKVAAIHYLCNHCDMKKFKKDNKY